MTEYCLYCNIRTLSTEKEKDNLLCSICHYDFIQEIELNELVENKDKK